MGKWVLLITAVLLTFSCGADENASDESKHAPLLSGTTANDGVPDPPPASDVPDLDVEEISELRRPDRRFTESAEAAVAQKRQSSIKSSPFFADVECSDWSGKDSDITAACCKLVVRRYNAMLGGSSVGEDRGLFSLTDPYLGACKMYNAEFRAAIDRIEHPEDNYGGAPPF